MAEQHGHVVRTKISYGSDWTRGVRDQGIGDDLRYTGGTVCGVALLEERR